jgi:hypothetical protein
MLYVLQRLYAEVRGKRLDGTISSISSQTPNMV